MIKVLIISPHFPPTNAADMQRVRMLLPHLASVGINAEVLAVEPGQVASPIDPWLLEGIPSDIPVHRVKAMSLAWTQVPGLGVLSNRAVRAIRHKGNALLSRQIGSIPKKSSFDLVYFSTTQFGIHKLGPEWKRKYGVPFVMDYQDPWVNDYYNNNPEITPPGGRLKYAIARSIARRQEPRVLRQCSGTTSVSDAYPKQLRQRYPWLNLESQNPDAQDKQLVSKDVMRDQVNLSYIVCPFPGDERDLERVRFSDTTQNIFDPADGLRHWVYVGRGGEDMHFATRSLFSATSQLKPGLEGVRLHFIGTSYAAAGRGIKTLESLASEYGLFEVVKEHTDRIPYSQALRCLLDAEAIIIPGSDDPGYTASKIYPYLLANKPTIAIFHKKSSVVQLIKDCGGGTIIDFKRGDTPDQIGERVASSAFDEYSQVKHNPLDKNKFEPHTAKHQANRISQFFGYCLAKERG